MVVWGCLKLSLFFSGGLPGQVNIVFVSLQVPNLVFLAVSPEEKESWVNALNVAIIKAKNRILDEVRADDVCL